jgi:hypothetical protein
MPSLKNLRRLTASLRNRSKCHLIGDSEIGPKRRGICYENYIQAFSASIVALLAAAGTAYGQQPPDVVASDSYSNTAMGTNALLNLTAGREFNTALGSDTLLSNTAGYSSTASGYAALASNTTGSANTASGLSALGSNTTGNYNTASGLTALLQDGQQ